MQESNQESFDDLMSMMDTMSLDDQKKHIRSILISFGTDCDLNDKDPCGNGDQSLINTSQGREAAREIFSIGGDIHAHLASEQEEQGVSHFFKYCIMGAEKQVEKMIQEALSSDNSTDLQTLLERRETSMRLSPLLGIVSAGKNLVVPGGLAKHEEVAKVLLKYGANPYAQDVVGKTVVHYGAGAMATEMTLNVVDMCIQASKSHHLFRREVQLFGLKAKDMNGKKGIVGGYDVDTGRRVISFKDITEKLLKPENLKITTIGGGNGELETLNPFKPLVDVQDRMGSVSLMEVIMQNRVDVAKFLLKKHDTNIYTEDADQMSPFKMSEGFGSVASRVGPMVMAAAARQGKKDHKARSEDRRSECANCKKPREEDELVQCGGCKQVFYCGKDCQKMHWNNGHRQECKAVSKGVKLDKPTASNGMFSSMVSLRSGKSTKPSNDPLGGYRKPKGVKVDEKFIVKVQSSSNFMPIMVYDESRHCSFDINPGSVGFEDIVQEIRKEPTWQGKKTFMSASFDANGDCTVYPATATPKYKW